VREATRAAAVALGGDVEALITQAATARAAEVEADDAATPTAEASRLAEAAAEVAAARPVAPAREVAADDTATQAAKAAADTRGSMQTIASCIHVGTRYFDECAAAT
jgi:hypothetical protein